MNMIFYQVEKSSQDMQTVSMVTWSGCQMPNTVMSFTQWGVVISHRVINSTISPLGTRRWIDVESIQGLVPGGINAHAMTPFHIPPPVVCKTQMKFKLF